MSALQKLKPNEPYSWKLISIINRLMFGAVNTVGSVTLARNATSTVLADNNIRRGCKVFFTPTTAHAATVSGLWPDPTSVPANGGVITLTHSAVNQADLNFDYVIFN